MNSVAVSFSPGQLYRRRDLHKKYGGQMQGGISTPAKAPFILLVTGDSGKQHGYADEWTEDGIFLYTGEGQRGDMVFVRGNLAIKDHKIRGKTLFVFEQDTKDKRYLRCLGEMECVDSFLREAPDTDGNPRKAIVFKLRPIGNLSPDSAILTAALGEVSATGGGFGSVETNRKVERAAVEFVRRHFENEGWNVRSVEADKVGYDLHCSKCDVSQHVEVKGTQAVAPCFIITAGEVRNAMIDHRHLTCVITAALTNVPQMWTYDREELLSQFELEPVAYRARLRATDVRKDGKN